MKKVLYLLLSLLLVLTVTACGGVGQETPQGDAVVKDGDVIGEGAKTFAAQIVDLEGNKVSFTVKTDKDIVGEALQELGVLEGEEGPYGLYIKKVNGMLADYDVDQTYWAFNKGGEAMMTGVDGQTIADGEAYELVRTK